jgi:hypothetical protein
MKPASRSIAATVSVVCSAYLPLRPLDVALIVLVFSVGELAMSRLFFAVGLRDRPYGTVKLTEPRARGDEFWSG